MKKNCCILFVADVSIANVIGGAERVLYQQSTILASRGYDVHVLTRRLPTHKRSQDEINGVHEWRYHVDDKTANAYLFSTLGNCRRLFEIINKKFAFNFVIFHQPLSAYAVQRSTAAMGMKKTYTCHSLWFEEYISRCPKTHGAFNKIIYLLNVRIRKIIEKRVLGASDRIIVLSRYTLEKLKRIYGISLDRLAVIPGGVDLERFQPGSNVDEIRRRLHIPSNRLVLFTVRNLVPRMGLENLINALSQVRDHIPEVYLVVGGSGPLKSTLMEITKKKGLDGHIRFSGFIPEESLPDYYRMSDLFVLPTRELEGFGLVTLEAMASGVTVIGTPVGGTLEILEQFDKSFITTDTGADAIANRIIEKCLMIRKDPSTWTDISNRCRRFVEERYSWEHHIDALESLMGKV